MGDKDLYQSDFYEDNDRFADAFNGVFFAGRQIMKPEELEEADSVFVQLPQKDKGKKVICDKVRRWKGRYVSIVILENQSYVDYQMVLRTMKAEVMGYEKQQREVYRRRRKEGVRFDRHEYLSRMKREEKFTPVITLVLYLGRDRAWDGARSLHELLEMEEELKPFINDYRLNLYDYHEHEDFSVFKTENRVLFELLSCLDDEKKVEEALKQHQEWYDELDEESAKAILGITGVKTNLKRLKKEEGKGGENMYSLCKAFADHMETGRKEGRKEDLENLMKNLNISLEQAMELLGIPEQDKENYLQLR